MSYIKLSYIILLISSDVYCDLFSRATRTKPLDKDLSKIVFDFVIVGGGTSGCVLANRLSSVPQWKVIYY